MTDRIEDFSDLIHKVEKLTEDGDYREAVNLCEAVQLHDELPRKFWFCKARALEELGDLRRAIDAYRCEIASLARVPPDLLGKVGSLLLDVGDYESGMVCLRECCQLSPSRERLVLLASAFAHLGQMDQSYLVVRQALELDPEYDEAWHNLGDYSLDLNDPQEAARAFRRAIELDPARSDSYGGLGQSYLAQGRARDAIDAAREGLLRNELEGICHQVIADGMEQMGDLDGAEAALLKAFRCDYARPTALLGLARVLERGGRIAEALAWYGRGLRAWPDDTRVSAAYLVFADTHKRDQPQLLEMFNRCDKIAPGNTN